MSQSLHLVEDWFRGGGLTIKLEGRMLLNILEEQAVNQGTD